MVDKLTGVFGGVACADRESEWRCKWSLETALDLCDVQQFSHTMCEKGAHRAMEGEWAPVADDGVDNTDKIQAVS